MMGLYLPCARANAANSGTLDLTYPRAGDRTYLQNKTSLKRIDLSLKINIGH